MNSVLYLSGKISGLPDLNKPKFDEAARKLKNLGFIVRNPHEICADVDPENWEACMKQCIKILMDCDQVILLDDWHLSRGAKEEFFLARTLRIPTFFYADFMAQFEREVQP